MSMAQKYCVTVLNSTNNPVKLFESITYFIPHQGRKMHRGSIIVTTDCALENIEY